MSAESVPQPWRSFLRELDEETTVSVDFHCLGGFVVSTCYGLPRPTADLDVCEIVPSTSAKMLLQRGGRDSQLHKKHGVHLQMVKVATLPENYEDRLHEMFPNAFAHLRLLALDSYDLALSKLGRNLDVDIEDVKYLARTVPFDLEKLRQRYREELRPILIGRPEREDLTLDLWVEAIEEERAAQPSTSPPVVRSERVAKKQTE